ncbi:Rap1a/Tai family immunity protein [Pseudomonas sp. NPDC087342]|uniref:Rap1a/Tai family immunity protein n=1 Tax=Pseudomonas sp. NPDC087342 TaxID=3364437 RepID=UPI00380833D7
MKTWMGVVALAGTIASSSAMALDGNGLLLQCQALIRSMEIQGPDTYDSGHCMGVVQGVTDVLVLYQDKLPKKFCIPHDVTYGQGVRIVTKYMQDNPSLLNNHDSVLVLAAYADAYPCK